jgi:acylphosphatase
MFMAAKRVRVVVSGDVQGVGFRWYTREEAMGRGVAGSVRNLPDGKVEAVFEGDARAVDAMVEWCRSGPTWARVDSVEVHKEPHRGEPGFRIDH